MPDLVLPIQGFLESTGIEPTAAVNLSGQRCVVPVGDGTVTYADAATLTHLGLSVWLTAGAALVGQPVQLVTFGQFIEPTWSWSLGPVYLGLTGHLTQVVPVSPAAVFLLQVGVAVRPTELHFDPRPPIRLQ